MRNINLAVILAAGMGTRINSIHKDKPKGFIQLGAQTIIEESISRLLRAGIKRVIIATGYKSEYYEGLKEKYPFIHTVQNDIYATTGSMYSLWCVKDLADEDFLLLESDLMYEYNALSTLLNDPRKDVILLSGKTNAGDEVYVGVNEDKILNMSKNINDIARLGGELVGISKISFELYKEMISHAETQFESRNNYHYEDCLTDLAQKRDIYFNLVNDLAWLEIDDESHYKRAVEIIYPLISMRDSS